MVRSNCFHVKVCMLSSPLYGSIKLCLVVYRQHIVTQKKPQNSPPFDFAQIDILTTKQFSLKVLRVLLLNPPYTNLPEWVVITSHLKKMHQKKKLMWNGLWLKSSENQSRFFLNARAFLIYPYWQFLFSLLDTMINQYCE